MQVKIMEAISANIQEMMCRDCPHAGYGEGEPWDGNCLRRDEYEEIEKLVGQLVKDILGRVRV